MLQKPLQISMEQLIELINCTIVSIEYDRYDCALTNQNGRVYWVDQLCTIVSIEYDRYDRALTNQNGRVD